MAWLQKAIAWIISIVMAILGFFGFHKKPVQPVDPPTTTTQISGDPFETPVIEI